MSGTAILAALATKLGKPATFYRQRNLRLIEAALQELERRILVVILDEAQNYSQPSLEEVRLLLGLNLPEQPAFALILIGDEYLLASLKLRNQRALYSRLGCQISLEPWTPAQCAQYLSTGLSAVGLSAAALEPAAAELLCQRQRRTAPQLCLLARAAWIAAATEPAQKITPAHVNRHPQVPWVPGLLHRAAAPKPEGLAASHRSGTDRRRPPTLLPVDRPSLRLGFDRERQWYEWLRAGFTLQDLRRVIGYLQREIREGRRNVGALKLSNLLQPDRFEEDLYIRRVRLEPLPRPPAKPRPRSPTRNGNCGACMICSKSAKSKKASAHRNPCYPHQH